jgi:tRNA(fMet)-specific endonuclease VapC
VAAGLVVADTNLLVDFLRGSDPGAGWVRGRLRDGTLRVTAVSAFELRLGADFLARQRGIDALLVHRTLPLDLLGAYRAGEVLSGLRRRGTPIGVNDALVAGICLRFDLPLATRNVREFRRVEDLRLTPADE